jgi:putative ABC transport system permease protein
VGLAVVIGALASLYPAMHASRLDPTVALRAL